MLLAAVLFTGCGSSNRTRRRINNISKSNITNTKNDTTTKNTTVEQVKKTVKVPDFSTMSKDEISEWCKSNNIRQSFSNEYSDTVEKDGFIGQSVSPDIEVTEYTTIKITYSLGKQPTIGEKNALSSAKSYLSLMAFSYSGLIKQLEFEGYSNEEATYAADNCGADWNEQAKKCAQSYLDLMSFSRSGLINQLEFEGFTREQAEYGVSAVGY